MSCRYGMLLRACTVALIVSPAVWLWAAEKSEPSQEPVAVVNGSEIKRVDFDREMIFAGESLKRRGQTPSDSQLSELREDVLDNLITLELLYQESKKKGIEVDQAEVDEQFVTLKKRLGSPEEMNKLLDKMHLSEADVKSQFRRTIAIQKFVEAELVRKVTVSDKEAKAFYDGNKASFQQPEQVKASHILIGIDGEGGEEKKAEARKEIEKIQQRLEKGEDFAALAKEFSRCPSAAVGGDLGYFSRGQMVGPFQDAAFALQPGEISDIVETRFGYHLIKMADKKPETTIPYQDVADEIEERLSKEKAQEAVRLYVADLKEKAKIEKLIEDDGS